MIQHIGKRIKQIIDEEGLSYDQFGEKIDVSGSSVGYWIDGRNEPRKKTINKMLEKFPYVDRTWLIDGIGQMRKLAGKFEEPEEKYGRPKLQEMKMEIEGLKAIIKSQEVLLAHFSAELAKLRKK